MDIKFVFSDGRNGGPHTNVETFGRDPHTGDYYLQFGDHSVTMIPRDGVLEVQASNVSETNFIESMVDSHYYDD